MVKKFECLKCGNCCKNFGSNESFSGLPLFEWEKQDFESLAKEKKIKLEITSTNTLFDKKSKQYVCLTYSMKNQPCPFLSNNMCSNYEKRPIVCRSFPLARNPIIDDEPIGMNCFMHCPNFNPRLFLQENLQMGEGKNLPISELKISGEYKKIFGEKILVYEAMHSNIWKYIKDKIRELEEEEIVDFENVKINPSPFKNISFFDFLVKINNISEKEKQDIISQLISYEKTKKLLFLN